MRKKAIGTAAVFLLAMLLALSVGGTANASGIENEVSEENEGRFGSTSPWLSGEDNSIYENPVDAREEEQDISVSSPGWVEENIAELFRNMSSSLISILQDNMGASLDSIIYGRVGSGRPDSVNMYAFELRKGNPYGVTAAVCYSLLRGMMFVFLGVHFAFMLAKAAWSGQTARGREEIKGQLPMLLVKFCAMMLMPYLLDVTIYVRDVLLYGIKEVTGQMVSGGATLSLSKAFLINAERSGTFVDAVMYLGTVVLTIYFVFLYVAVAIDMLVCFVSFPFICVLHGRKRDLIGGWIATVFSNLMTPVVDAVLLLVPLLTSMMLSDVIRGVAVIQLVMCMLIIPARARFKALLGIQSNEKNGFLGAMAVMTLTRALAAGVKRGAGRVAEALSDAKRSRIHGELAETDREEEAELLSADAGRRDNGASILPEEEGGEGARMQEGTAWSRDSRPEEMGSNMDEEPVPYGEPGEDTASGTGSGSGIELQTEEGEYVEGAGDSGLRFEDSGTVQPEGGRTGAAAEDVENEITGSTKDARIDALREADRKVEQSQNALDSLRMERAETVVKDRQLKRNMLDCVKGSEEYRNLEKERADMESRTAVLDKKIAQESARLNRLRRQSGELHTAFGMKSTPTGFEERRAEILRKRADINNFEQPEFKGILSNDQMRKLYRNRAIAGGVKSLAGTAGAAAGGAIGGSSAIFLGGSAVAMAAAGGIRAGGNVGEAAVDTVQGAGQIICRGAGAAGRRAYRTAEMAASSYLIGKMMPAAVQVRVGGGMPGDAGTDTDTSAAVILDQNPVSTKAVRPEPEVMVMDSPSVASDETVEVRDVTETEGMKAQIAYDVRRAVEGVMSREGDVVSGSMLHVLQRANIRLEREVAVMREEAAVLTEDVIRKRRAAIRTEMLSEAIVARMEELGYQKGTEEYADAEELVWKKVRELFDESEKPLI